MRSRRGGPDPLQIHSEVHSQTFEGDETIDYAFGVGPRTPPTIDGVARYSRTEYRSFISWDIAPGRYQAMLLTFHFRLGRVAFGVPRPLSSVSVASATPAHPR